MKKYEKKSLKDNWYCYGDTVHIICDIIDTGVFSSGGSGFIDLTNVVMYFLAAFSALSAAAAFIIFKILKNN